MLSASAIITAMRHVAIVTLCCVALLGELGVAGADARAPQPTLGIEWNFPRSRLVRVDPTTLRRVGSASLALGEFTHGLAFSPGKERAVAPRYERPALRFLDLGGWRVLGDVPIANEGVVDELDWLGPDRVLAVVRDATGTTIVEVNASRKSVVSRLRFRGRDVGYFRRAGALLLALEAPMRRIGPARLLVFTGSGVVRVVRLDRIAKGTVFRGRDVIRTDQPGLAVDSAGRTAFIVNGGRTAEVDLETLAVEYHEVRTTTARAKGTAGSSWQARWEAGTLIVSGYHGPRFTGNGLRLVDTETWEAQLVDARMGSFSVVDGLVLGLSDTALVAYGLNDGRLRWRLDEPEISGAYTVTRPYVHLDRNDRSTAIVDIRTGRVVARATFAGRSVVGDPDSW